MSLPFLTVNGDWHNLSTFSKPSKTVKYFDSKLKTSNNLDVSIEATTNAELVLFISDENAEVFKDGMYSGNKV